MHFLNFFKYFIYLFSEREREGEKHQCVVASHAPPTGDLACNPGMCPEWEANQRPFGSQATPQSHTSQGTIYFQMLQQRHVYAYMYINTERQRWRPYAQMWQLKWHDVN